MSIFQRRRQHQDLVARFKTGSEIKEIKVAISPQSIAGYVALSQRPLVVDDPYEPQFLSNIHPRLKFADRFDKSSAFKTKSILCVPIMNAGVLLGVMQVINSKQGHFDLADQQSAEHLANLCGNRFRFEWPVDFKSINAKIHLIP